MSDMSDVDLSRNDIDPVIRKWTEDFHDMAVAAEDGTLLRQDFYLDPPHDAPYGTEPIHFVLFGRHGEEQNMQSIADLYEWEEGGCKGPPPTDKDMGELLGYTQEDVKAWNLVNTLSSAARYAPFLIPAINDYMINHNVPNRDAKIENMLANPTDRQIDIPRVAPPPAQQF